VEVIITLYCSSLFSSAQRIGADTGVLGGFVDLVQKFTRKIDVGYRKLQGTYGKTMYTPGILSDTFFRWFKLDLEKETAVGFRRGLRYNLEVEIWLT
jgi:hypothetical protein